MTTPRGKAKMDLSRAKFHAKSIPERMLYLKDLYHDFPEWAKSVETVCEAALSMEVAIGQLLENLP